MTSDRLRCSRRTSDLGVRSAGFERAPYSGRSPLRSQEAEWHHSAHEGLRGALRSLAGTSNSRITQNNFRRASVRRLLLPHLTKSRGMPVFIIWRSMTEHFELGTDEGTFHGQGASDSGHNA
jgi:hypothetical protein